jgi:long-chain acyl-CoA synthetase
MQYGVGLAGPDETRRAFPMPTSSPERAGPSGGSTLSDVRNLGDILSRRDFSKIALIETRAEGAAFELSYAALNQWIDRTAFALAQMGLRRGCHIGIISNNRWEYLVAYFGIMRAGFVAVPLNVKLPAETIKYILEDAEIKVVFADEHGLVLCSSDIRTIVFGSAAIDGFDAFTSKDGAVAVAQTGDDDIAMLLYTSGSTGRPKGVPLTHSGQLWALRARSRAVPLRDHRFLVAAPFFHMNGLFSAKLVLSNGATLVMMPRFDARGYIDAIHRHRCTWLTSVPTMLAMVAREHEALAAADLSCVRYASMASAPVTEKLIADVQRVFPTATVTLGYGTTEAGPAVFMAHPSGKARPALSLGYPIADIEIRLVTRESQDADLGILHLKTPALMPAYLHQPDLTAKVVSDGWYDTGDVMRRDADGFYYFVGRSDDMFVCGGENIFPGEVEHMLERHEDIVQSCVVPVEDEIKGHKPVAFVVARAGSTLSESDVKAYALASAPAYQHPRRVFIVPSLPLAGTNKIDRALLMREARAASSAA